MCANFITKNGKSLRMSIMIILYLFLLFFCGCSNQEPEASPEEIVFIEDEEEIKELSFSGELSLQEMIIQNPSNLEDNEDIR